jgi:hypothetical protein
VLKTDVSDVAWAQDDSNMLAVMEKTKLTILQGTEAEEPIRTGNYLVGFSNLEIATVDLVALMSKPEVHTFCNCIQLKLRTCHCHLSVNTVSNLNPT